MTKPGIPDAAREGNEAGLSAPDAPVAIVGMACRFPNADGLAAFWRMLEAGESGVIEGGSGLRRPGRIGELFPEGTGQPPGVPVRCLSRRARSLRRRLLPHLAGGGAVPRSATADDAGGLLARAGRRGHGPGPAERQPHRRLCGDQQQRVSRADPGEHPARRARRQPLFRHRHLVQHRDRPRRLRARPGRAGAGARYRLLVLPGRDPPGGDGPSAGRGRSRPGGAACTRSSPAGCWRCAPTRACCPRTGAVPPSMPPRMATCAAKAVGSWCSSALPTRKPTATASGR